MGKKALFDTCCMNYLLLIQIFGNYKDKFITLYNSMFFSQLNDHKIDIFQQIKRPNQTLQMMVIFFKYFFLSGLRSRSVCV